MMTVPIKLKPTFLPGAPEKLFEGPYEPWFDMLPDGKHFVMLRRELAELAEINVVLNWHEELKRLVPSED